MSIDTESAGPRGLRDIRRKAVDLSQTSLVKAEQMVPGSDLPLLITPASDNVDLVEWAPTQREYLNQMVYKHGAVMFRGFSMKSVADFEKAAAAVSGDLYGGYGDLPRAGTSEKIYQSTPYPPDKMILYHSESSHLDRWPMRIAFFSVIVAREGGATPIMDNRAVCREMDPEVLEKFARLGVRYTRNFVEGIDVSWRQFFQTDDKAAVEQICRDAGIDFEWAENDSLRTSTFCQAVRNHPVTGERIFFNQVQLHHVSCLDAATRQSLVSLFGDNPPRNVYYGDGSVIEDETMNYLGELYEKLAIRGQWHQGDMIVLDNMLTSHARDPFVGERKIAVAMSRMTGDRELAAA